jgi:hypothetical protein
MVGGYSPTEKVFWIACYMPFKIGKDGKLQEV